MNYYLGLDCSTQSLTGQLVRKSDLGIEKEISIVYANHFPDFSPALIKEDGSCTVDVRLYLKAFDLFFKKLKDSNIDCSEIQAIGGCAQQHASIYLNENWLNEKNFSKGFDLEEIFTPLLSRSVAPIWLDSSTSEECAKIQAQLPDSFYASRISGSKITERFAGPQIKKFSKLEPNAYHNTKRIHLLSSFLTSILIGKDATIDPHDASGMNLLNIHNQQWDDTLCNATANDLSHKLPVILHPYQTQYKIGKYFINKFGFSPTTKICPFSGDNISSFIGCEGNTSTAILSLGTSDTLSICSKDHYIDNQNLNTFIEPNQNFLYLLCVKNGAFVRNKIREENGQNWEEFNESIKKTAIGNNNIGMLPFLVSEINPFLKNPVYKFLTSKDLNKHEKSRAVLEAQALNLKIQSTPLLSKIKRIIITGGGSHCQEFCQIIANIFQVEVFTSFTAQSAAFGGALMAKNLENKSDSLSMQSPRNNQYFPDSNVKPIYLKLEAQMKNEIEKIYLAN